MREGERTMKLHPLHTPEWLNCQVVNTGCYPDISRHTGRTTAHCLDVLSKAIRCPGETVRFQDHHPTTEANMHMANKLQDMIGVLGLQHMHINRREFSVVFMRHEQPLPSGYTAQARM